MKKKITQYLKSGFLIVESQRGSSKLKPTILYYLVIDAETLLHRGKIYRKRIVKENETLELSLMIKLRNSWVGFICEESLLLETWFPREFPYDESYMDTTLQFRIAEESDGYVVFTATVLTK